VVKKTTKYKKKMAPATQKVAQPSTTAAAAGSAANAAANNNNETIGCMKCGREVAETDSFCIYCGTKVAVSVATHNKTAKTNPRADSKQPSGPAQATASPSQQVPRKSASEHAKSPSERPKPSSAPSQSANPGGPPRMARHQSDNRLNASAVHERPSARDHHIAARGSLPDDFREVGRSSLDQIPHIASIDQLWVPDDFSKECMDCKINFGFPKPRRHHCRVCGLLFCRPCVQSKMSIPSSFGYGTVAQRCCRSCVTALQLKAITSPADVFAQRKGKKTGVQRETPYEVLGVTPGSTSDEITRRYKTLSRSVDLSSNEGKEKLEKLKEAYRTLQDPVERLRHESDMQGRDSTSSTVNEQIPTEQARSDQQECQVCFRPFKLGRRQHHCRRCTRSVCTTCSDETKSLPELGFPMAVRQCNTCLENPTKFIPPVMDAVAKPPAGFEYLSKLDILVDVKNVSSSHAGELGDDLLLEVKTFCDANAEAAKSSNYKLTDADKAIANEYFIVHKRRFTDFEWLFHALGDMTNAKALPYMPDRKSASRDADSRQLRTFLSGCLMHSLLRDADCLKAFLTLPKDEFQRFQASHTSRTPAIMYPNDNNKVYSGVIMALRLEFEKAQMRNKLNELLSRQKAHEQRVEEQKKRVNSQKKRMMLQNVRREQAKQRFVAFTQRQTAQETRSAREEDRLNQQTTQEELLWFDTLPDENERTKDEQTREKLKIEFTKSKDAFQNDTSAWNEDMAYWSAQRAKWSEHHNPQASKDIANDWILKSYGVYHSSKSDAETNTRMPVPSELVEMHNMMLKLMQREPTFMEVEGEALDQEWTVLAKEREHWTKDRADFKKEDGLCAEEDARFTKEHAVAQQAQEARRKKIQAIELDLDALQVEIQARNKSLALRNSRQVSLVKEFQEEWSVVQQKRHALTLARLLEHENRISRSDKRVEVFKDQLTRQKNCKKMLLFKRAQVLEEKTKDLRVFEENVEESRQALEDAKNALSLTPEYIERLQQDLQIAQEEMGLVYKSNQLTTHEKEGHVNQKDAFMVKVVEKRALFQQELDHENQRLQKEEEMCAKLLKEMRMFMEKLQEEVTNSSKEVTFVKNFKSNLLKEQELLDFEEKIRDQKKHKITEIMNDAGNWVLEALHDHSKRKKKEADRLVKQAGRAADLQKLVQHFTHRVIEQEERILRQKQRILNGEHKVEMLKSSENWYLYVTLLSNGSSSADRDLGFLSQSMKQRASDLKKALELQKEDEKDFVFVRKEVDHSKKCEQEKLKRRQVWQEIEEVYSVKQSQEKEEDLMMTSQIRSLLMQLSEAFEMLSNRLLEEEESLNHAIEQLQGEVESIGSFMQRMESEETSLCNTEKASLTKEKTVAKNEDDLIEQRARSLVEKYKKLLSDHSKLPVEMEKIVTGQPKQQMCLPKEIEMDQAKKLLKTRNFYDKQACAAFQKKFKVTEKDLREVRDVFEWIKGKIEQDIRQNDKWMDHSRKTRKRIDLLRVKAQEIDWEKDTLAKIPAFQEMLQKLMGQKQGKGSSAANQQEQDEKDNSPKQKQRKNSSSGALGSASAPSSQEHDTNNGSSPNKKNQWILDLIELKRHIEDIDSKVVQNVQNAVQNAQTEEEIVQSHTQRMKQDKEFLLNSLRVIDLEESKAIRNYEPRAASSTSPPTSNQRTVASILASERSRPVTAPSTSASTSSPRRSNPSAASASASTVSADVSPTSTSAPNSNTSVASSTATIPSSTSNSRTKKPTKKSAPRSEEL